MIPAAVEIDVIPSHSLLDISFRNTTITINIRNQILLSSLLIILLPGFILPCPRSSSSRRINCFCFYFIFIIFIIFIWWGFGWVLVIVVGRRIRRATPLPGEFIALISKNIDLITADTHIFVWASITIVGGIVIPNVIYFIQFCRIGDLLSHIISESKVCDVSYRPGCFHLAPPTLVTEACACRVHFVCGRGVLYMGE